MHAGAFPVQKLCTNISSGMFFFHALQGSRTFGPPVAAHLPAAVGSTGELLYSGFKFVCAPH